MISNLCWVQGYYMLGVHENPQNQFSDNLICSTLNRHFKILFGICLEDDWIVESRPDSHWLTSRHHLEGRSW